MHSRIAFRHAVEVQKGYRRISRSRLERRSPWSRPCTDTSNCRQLQTRMRFDGPPQRSTPSLRSFILDCANSTAEHSRRDRLHGLGRRCLSRRRMQHAFERGKGALVRAACASCLDLRETRYSCERVAEISQGIHHGRRSQGQRKRKRTVIRRGMPCALATRLSECAVYDRRTASERMHRAFIKKRIVQTCPRCATASRVCQIACLFASTFPRRISLLQPLSVTTRRCEFCARPLGGGKEPLDAIERR